MAFQYERTMSNENGSRESDTPSTNAKPDSYELSAMTVHQSLDINAQSTQTDPESDSALNDAADTSIPKNTARKRKRTRLDTAGKFECRECGKAYSRAEHLYRHQLNHAPKQIFRCDWPNCSRSFVRQDLRARHMDRHLARKTDSPAVDLSERHSLPAESHLIPAPRERTNSDSKDSQDTPLDGDGNRLHINKARTFEDLQHVSGSNVFQPVTASSLQEVRDSKLHKQQTSALPTTSFPFQATMPAPTVHHSASFRPTSVPSPAWSNGSDGPYTNLSGLPSPAVLENYRKIPASGQARGAHYEHSPSSRELDGRARQGSGFYDSPTSHAAYPFPDEYAWLFDPSNLSSMDAIADNGNFGMFSEHHYLQDLDFDLDSYQPPPPSNPMAVTNLIDVNLPESKLSNTKRRDLLHLIISKFSDADQIPERRYAKNFLEGDHESSSHVLSLAMMQTYIGSYWYHFHPQVPILHKPTFSADECPDLLLLAMMTLGASCLERIHGHTTTQLCAELASFVAWHLRWALFRHEASRPPAKLWMFQALLLLEFFEKMYSTRELHERGHIHHATTVTLLRRGNPLVGKAAGEPESSDNKSRTTTVSTGDKWWDNWIAKEATRRAVFAAFIMDIQHAISFAHSVEMATHEMRLPLPCDEALWSATSGNEVSRIEASLQANGVKPLNFLEALKRTLNHQRVQTNPFGRTTIMAGLLSVSWHLNQRDLQITALGVGGQKPAGKAKWRISMAKAFAFWKEDFDLSLAQAPVGPSVYPPSYRQAQGIDDENVFESRIVMLHLAHMSMHVDIVDCQVFAGATVLIGRHVSEHDHATAKRRIKEVWAPSDRAREATFHALKFISQVLMPEEQEDSGHVSTGFHNSSTPDYSAREDFLINRPWILFIAGLIIWCYGYALDGPVTFGGTFAPPETKEEKIADMKLFLRRVGSIESSEELNDTRGRSSCIGLLMTLKDLFVETRWELLHEAASLLELCVDKLLMKQSPD